MFDLEPGPMDLGELPLPARIATDGLFERLAADYVDARSNEGLVLGQASADVAADGIPDENGIHAAILGSAEDAHATETQAGDTTIPAGTLDAGENINGHAAAVAPYLPPADSAVPANFTDPPQPPSGWTPPGPSTDLTPPIDDGM